MNKLFKYVCLIFLLSMAQFPIHAQELKTLSGVIVDEITREPIPFANVFLKSQHIGTMSNDSGLFKFNILVSKLQDTLVVSSVGYNIYSSEIPYEINYISIALKSSREVLNEVLISPLPPTYYINRAMKSSQLSRPSNAHITYGYYHEEVLENKKILRNEEAVFKSYVPAVKDKLKRQYQLILYRQAKKVAIMQFVLKERIKMEEKENKENKNSDSLTGIDYVFLSGGPPVMLRYATINKRADNYLDSTKFKYYNYFFEPSNNKETDTMVINFNSKIVTDHMRRKGKIYIHLPTNTVIKIEGHGNFVVPALLRPLMFLYGFNTKELSFDGVKEYQIDGGNWYFKTATVHARINLVKRHLFSSNEQAEFEGKQSFTLFKIKNENIAPIDSVKRFNHDKKMSGQVFKDEGVKWEEIDKLNLK